MTPPETVSTTASGDAHATAPLTCTFGPQGPTLGDLIDAYLQDYQVRQFRSVSTARGRTAHLAAFFGRAARAAALTTYQIRQYQLARRAAGAATGTINRETSALHRMGTLAVHWGWLDTVPGFPDRLRENPPRQGFFEHPEYLAVRAHLPAPWQDILDVAYYSGWRKQEILGLTWDEIDEAGGVIRLSPARSKTLVGRILPISPPIAEALARRRARRDPTSPLVFHRDGITIRRWRTAWRTACQSAGVPTRFLHDCRRTAARNLIRANVPERVAMLLTGHKSRAIFDRYNIIHEQELLDAGDQLVEYLAQQAPDTARLFAAARAQAKQVRTGQRSWHTWQQGGPTRPNTGTCQAPPAASRSTAGRHAITGSLDTRGWRLYDGAVADHRACAHDREENPLFGEPLWLLRATAWRTAPRACEGAGVDGGRRVGAVRPQQPDRPGECGLGVSDRAGRSPGRSRGRWTVRGGQRLSAG